MNDRVLITRPLERSASLAAALERLGYAPLYSPLLEIMPTGTALPEPARYSGIVFTSQSAIPFVPASDVPVFTVGEATAAAVRRAGFKEVTCGGQDVAGLAGYLATRMDLRDKTLLYPSATNIAHDPAALMPDGPRILHVPVYQAVPLPLQKTTIGHLYAGEVAWIVVASARTAETLCEALQQLERLDWTGNTGLACLAPHIADRLAAYRWRRVETASEPTEAGLLACFRK